VSRCKEWRGWKVKKTVVGEKVAWFLGLFHGIWTCGMNRERASQLLNFICAWAQKSSFLCSLPTIPYLIQPTLSLYNFCTYYIFLKLFAKQVATLLTSFEHYIHITRTWWQSYEGLVLLDPTTRIKKIRERNIQPGLNIVLWFRSTYFYILWGKGK
jgi:hypothetical protein